MDPLRGTSEPTALVEVRLTRDPASSDVSAAPPLLAFTAADWDAPQTVTVSAAEDDDAVADGSVAIRHEVSGGDYDSVPAARVTVTIAENDVPTLSVADAEVSEGAPGGDLAVVFQVELSVPSDNEVTADYATSDGSGLEGAAAGSDYEATTGTVRFPPLTTMAQPIRVPVTDDAGVPGRGERSGGDVRGGRGDAVPAGLALCGGRGVADGGRQQRRRRSRPPGVPGCPLH